MGFRKISKSKFVFFKAILKETAGYRESKQWQRQSRENLGPSSTYSGYVFEFSGVISTVFGV